MKKFFVILLMFVVSTAAQATVIFSTGFETTEGYSESGTKLTANGWYRGTSAWVVPSTADTFAETGTRSARCLAVYDSTRWCNYSTSWTPTDDETTVSYSASVAFQKYYGNVGAGAFAGIALYGSTDGGVTETLLGGIQILANGTVSIMNSSGTSTATTTTYGYILEHWYQLTIQADFESNTVEFLFDGVVVGSTTLSDDVASLSSISTYCGEDSAVSKTMGTYVRYDDISVTAIPEPATIYMLGLGVLSFIRLKRI